MHVIHVPTNATCHLVHVGKYLRVNTVGNPEENVLEATDGRCMGPEDDSVPNLAHGGPDASA
jgi:hypothetical protein